MGKFNCIFTPIRNNGTCKREKLGKYEFKKKAFSSIKLLSMMTWLKLANNEHIREEKMLKGDKKMKIGTKKLQEIIESHGKWLKFEDGGKCADLRDANLRDADLQDAGLRGADLQGADLQGADLRGADLRGADLQDADLRGANLQGAYLQGAYLQGAYLQGASLRGANLRDANLRDADLRDADLRGASLRGADLQGAYLQDANLQGAYLQGANLRDAHLRDAYLQGAYLQDANLQDAYLQGAGLPNGIYQIVGCGSCNRCTTYDSINDRVICGCWEDGGGNHLESFKKRIETIYGDKGEAPNAAYYIEYMAAINFFEMVKRVRKL